MSQNEVGIIKLISSLRKKSPFQLNQMHEADAELIQLGNSIFAWTIDTVQEEFDIGLFKNPYTQGWLAAICSLSDLAAVGASPIGLLFNCSLPFKNDTATFKLLFQGIEDCLFAHRTFWLGGDTNNAQTLSLTSTGLGIVENGRYHKRNTFNVGDKIFYCGQIGIGNVVALANTLTHPRADMIEQAYRPKVDFLFLQEVSHLITSAIDTSDGLFATANILTKFSRGGVTLDQIKLFYPDFLQKISKELGLPELLFGFGEVGDYGILFTAAEKNSCHVESIIKKHNIDCRIVGEITETEGLWLKKNEMVNLISYDKIKLDLSDLSPKEYISYLLRVVMQYLK